MYPLQIVQIVNSADTVTIQVIFGSVSTATVVMDVKDVTKLSASVVSRTTLRELHQVVSVVGMSKQVCIGLGLRHK
ncbi:MAG: hypothetical protein ACK5DE_10045 [Bacteroidota bacterium]